jgi:hypothetical protein
MGSEMTFAELKSGGGPIPVPGELLDEPRVANKPAKVCGHELKPFDSGTVALGALPGPQSSSVQRGGTNSLKSLGSLPVNR